MIRKGKLAKSLGREVLLKDFRLCHACEGGVNRTVIDESDLAEKVD